MLFKEKVLGHGVPQLVMKASMCNFSSAAISHNCWKLQLKAGQAVINGLNPTELCTLSMALTGAK